MLSYAWICTHLINYAVQAGRLIYGGKTFHLDQRWTEIPVGLIRHGRRLHVFYGSAEIISFDVGDMRYPNRPPRSAAVACR